VVGVHLPVQQIHAGNLHGFNDGIDFGGIAAFGKIRNAFYESVRHRRRIMIYGGFWQLAVPATEAAVRAGRILVLVLVNCAQVKQHFFPQERV
jgi:hypothetical protein